MNGKAFISFGDVTSGATSSSSRGDASSIVSSSPIYGGLDEELVTLSKSVLKKDEKTRIKALIEICQVLERKQSVVVTDFLSFFLYAYERLWNDDSIKIRELVFKVLSLLVRYRPDKKTSLNAYIRGLIGPWWISTYDLDNNVNSTARDTLEDYLVTDRNVQFKQKAIDNFAPIIMKKVYTTITTLNSSNSKASLSDEDEKNMRIAVTAINSLSPLLTSVSSFVLDSICDISSTTSTGTDKEVISLSLLLTEINKVFISNYGSEQRPLRLAILRMYEALCALMIKQYTQLKSDSNGPLVGTLTQTCSLIINSIGQWPRDSSINSVDVYIRSLLSVVKLVPSALAGFHVGAFYGEGTKEEETETGTQTSFMITGAPETTMEAIEATENNGASGKKDNKKKHKRYGRNLSFHVILDQLMFQSPDITMRYLLPLLATMVPNEYTCVKGKALLPPASGYKESKNSNIHESRSQWPMGELLLQWCSTTVHADIGDPSITRQSLLEVMTFMLLKEITESSHSSDITISIQPLNAKATILHTRAATVEDMEQRYSSVVSLFLTLVSQFLKDNMHSHALGSTLVQLLIKLHKSACTGSSVHAHVGHAFQLKVLWQPLLNIFEAAVMHNDTDTNGSGSAQVAVWLQSLFKELLSATATAEHRYADDDNNGTPIALFYVFTTLVSNNTGILMNWTNDTIMSTEIPQTEIGLQLSQVKFKDTSLASLAVPADEEGAILSLRAVVKILGSEFLKNSTIIEGVMGSLLGTFKGDLVRAFFLFASNGNGNRNQQVFLQLASLNQWKLLQDVLTVTDGMLSVQWTNMERQSVLDTVWSPLSCSITGVHLFVTSHLFSNYHRHVDLDISAQRTDESVLLHHRVLYVLDTLIGKLLCGELSMGLGLPSTLTDTHNSVTPMIERAEEAGHYSRLAIPLTIAVLVCMLQDMKSRQQSIFAALCTHIHDHCYNVIQTEGKGGESGPKDVAHVLFISAISQYHKEHGRESIDLSGTPASLFEWTQHLSYLCKCFCTQYYSSPSKQSNWDNVTTHLIPLLRDTEKQTLLAEYMAPVLHVKNMMVFWCECQWYLNDTYEASSNSNDDEPIYSPSIHQSVEVGGVNHVSTYNDLDMVMSLQSASCYARLCYDFVDLVYHCYEVNSLPLQLLRDTFSYPNLLSSTGTGSKEGQSTSISVLMSKIIETNLILMEMVFNQHERYTLFSQTQMVFQYMPSLSHHENLYVLTTYLRHLSNCSNKMTTAQVSNHSTFNILLSLLLQHVCPEIRLSLFTALVDITSVANDDNTDSTANLQLYLSLLAILAIGSSTEINTEEASFLVEMRDCLRLQGAKQYVDMHLNHVWLHLGTNKTTNKALRRIRSPSISSSASNTDTRDVLRAGTQVYYIQSTSRLANTENDGNNMNRVLSLEAAIITGIHQDGQRPAYYTISIPRLNVEKQTDWNRLLLCDANTDIDNEEMLKKEDVLSSITMSSSSAISNTLEDALDSPCGIQVALLDCLLRSLITTLPVQLQASHRTTNLYYHLIFATKLLDLLQSVSLSTWQTTPLLYEKYQQCALELNTMVLSKCRGYLVDTDIHPRNDGNSDKHVHLLWTLGQSQCGIGNGLWLPLLLNKLHMYVLAESAHDGSHKSGLSSVGHMYVLLYSILHADHGTSGHYGDMIYTSANEHKEVLQYLKSTIQLAQPFVHYDKLFSSYHDVGNNGNNTKAMNLLNRYEWSTLHECIDIYLCKASELSDTNGVVHSSTDLPTFNYYALIRCQWAALPVCPRESVTRVSSIKTGGTVGEGAAVGLEGGGQYVRPRPWESNAFANCLKVLRLRDNTRSIFVPSNAGTTSSGNIDALMALYHFSSRRNVSAVHEIMSKYITANARTATRPLLEELHAWCSFPATIIGDSDGSNSSRDITNNNSNSCVLKRIVALKLLDIWYCSHSTAQFGDLLLTEAEKNEKDGCKDDGEAQYTSDSDDNEDESEVEKKERERDKSILVEAVGQDLWEQLCVALDILEGRPIDSKVEEDHSSSHSSLSSLSISSPTSSSSPSKKTKIRYLDCSSPQLHDDHLYERHIAVMSHLLLLLQKIDTAALNQQDKGWYVRARSGAHLKSGGHLYRLANLLMVDSNLNNPNSKQRTADLKASSTANTFMEKSVRILHVPSALILLNASRKMERPCETSVSVLDDNGEKEDTNDKDETDDSSRVHSKVIIESRRSFLIHLSMACLYRLITVLPTATRSWYSSECSRQQKQNIAEFVESEVRPCLLSRELELMRNAQDSGQWNDDEMSVSGNATVGEVTAAFVHDDSKIEIKIKVPVQYPLKHVEVECLTRLGIPESKWKRWSFQVIHLLSGQDGTLIDGILLWKKNLDREFEGLEPCVICYSLLHAKTMALPTLACPTCGNKFHNQCLHQWFKSSGKNKCVLCQQPFF